LNINELHEEVEAEVVVAVAPAAVDQDLVAATGGPDPVADPAAAALVTAQAVVQAAQAPVQEAQVAQAPVQEAQVAQAVAFLQAQAVQAVAVMSISTGM
jgi:hypothetical protein